MTLDLGSWELWADARHSLVMDVDPHVAFAYLLTAEGAMRASVWLFNLPGPAPEGDEALPVVSDVFVKPGATAPATLDEIDVSHDGGRWTIRWPGGRALISKKAKLGWNSSISADSPFAQPFAELPI